MRPFLILALCFALSSCTVVSRSSMPAVGTPAHTGPLFCPSGTIEVRMYDYDPPRDDRWKAVGFGVRGERDFAQVYADTPDGERKVYLDLNRDGRVDKVLSMEQAMQQYPTVCDMYEQEIARRQASR